MIICVSQMEYLFVLDRQFAATKAMDISRHIEGEVAVFSKSIL